MKKIWIIALIISASVMIASCGSSENSEQSKAESTTPAVDEDGNVEINVHLKNSKLHGNLSKKWEREKPSNREKKIIEKVEEIFNVTNLSVDSKLFECIYDSYDDKMTVWTLLSGRNEESLDNYGIIIIRDDKEYTFPNLCHGKNPVVDYNEKLKKLFIGCDVIEGTGVHTEVLYVFDVKDDSVTYSTLLDPYEVQEYFVDKMSYDASQNEITFKVNNKVIGKMINTEDGEGALRSVVVGDQIAYEFDEEHNIKVNVIPGIKFGPGTSLHYEESPTLVADVVYSNNGFKLNNIKLAEE